jgi:hypothetical protein
VDLELAVNRSNVAFANLGHGLCESDDEEEEHPDEAEGTMPIIIASLWRPGDDIGNRTHLSLGQQVPTMKPPPHYPYPYLQPQPPPKDPDTSVDAQLTKNRDGRYEDDHLLRKNADRHRQIDSQSVSIHHVQHDGRFVDTSRRSFQRDPSSHYPYGVSSSSRPVVAMRSVGIKYPKLSALIRRRDEGQDVGDDDNNNNDGNDNSNQDGMNVVDSSEDDDNDAEMDQDDDDDDDGEDENSRKVLETPTV